ncbi:MAG: tryptophan--tRNA ligase [Thermoplasmata archaeon]
MRIDPWASAQFADYGRLLQEFGIGRFEGFELPRPHRLFRRGVVFGHRGFELVYDAILERKPFAVLTGLMPSGDMHLGHKMVLDQVMYFQSLGADVFIAVADIEAYATRNVPLEKGREIAIEQYIKSYIALGLKRDRCQIYFQSTRGAVKDLAYILGKRVNLSAIRAIYGMDDSTSMAHMFAPLVQAGDILHVQLPKYGGPRPTLVPVGVDQDPHIRLSRDIASAHRLCNVTVARDGRVGVFVKVDEGVDELLSLAESVARSAGFRTLRKIPAYKALYINDASPADVPKLDGAMIAEEARRSANIFFQPSSTYHRFITGLTGDKMSSSRPESAIFLSDQPAAAAEKVMRAKTGGAVSVEEQRRSGGKPEECSVYEMLLYHLVEDDAELDTIYNSCRSGERLCGACKREAARLAASFLKDFQEKKASVGGSWRDWVVEDH